MSMRHFDLDKHKREFHQLTPFSQYVREIIYGGSDGIVTTFAVVAGFAGAQINPAASSVPVYSVLLFGLANLFADGVSMSLGNFLSIRADQDVYKSEKLKEHHEIIHSKAKEVEETIAILIQKGFSDKDAQRVAALYQKNPSYWTEFMMTDELKMSNPENEKPMASAISTFCAFVGFGIVPLFPYIYGGTGSNLFLESLMFTVLSLFLLGILRAIVTGRNTLRGIGETLIVGGISASVAYVVGSFFRFH